jgi:hypothetical protein
MTINDGTPELMDLPVYREDFISQERVDELCKMIS